MFEQRGRYIRSKEIAELVAILQARFPESDIRLEQGIEAWRIKSEFAINAWCTDADRNDVLDCLSMLNYIHPNVGYTIMYMR